MGVAVFHITGGVSFADTKLHEAEKIEDAFVEFGPLSHEYAWGMIDAKGWPFISKDGKEWSIALTYEIDGHPVSASEIADYIRSKEEAK